MDSTGQRILVDRTMMESESLATRIEELLGWAPRGPVQVVTDTTNWMDIYRGHVLLLGGRHFVIRGNPCETRFGIKDQPKYWVFTATELETGEEKVIKAGREF